jgi:hypothetical protein
MAGLANSTKGEGMKGKLTIEDMRLWVLNDEGLYRWWQQERGDIRAFIRRNREEIEAGINRVLNQKPAPSY